MAYNPGQPWDPSLSYSQGQTCTYNGLPYICFSGYGSDAGTKPNEAMAIYDSSLGPSQTDRTWVLCDNNDATLPSYGDRTLILKALRGLPSALVAIFENPQGIKVTGALAETDPVSGAYYGWPAGMSVDYAGGFVYAGTYAGIQDNPGSPYFPRPDQRGAFLPTVEYVDEDSSGITLKASWGAGENANIELGGADTSGNLIWFERTFGYTITVKWYNSSDALVSTLTTSGTVTSPSITDGWTETGAYGPDHFFARPSTAAYSDYSISITDVSPSLSS